MASESSPQFTEAILKQAKRKYEDRKNDSIPQKGFDEFLKTLADPESSKATPIATNTTYDLSQYFISSSHNTYLTGNQLWSKASTDAYKHVLKRGCRCIEIDVWNGESASPSSSESEQGEREVNKLTGLMKKGLGRLRSGSKSQDQVTSPDTPVADADDQNLAPTPWRTQSGTRDEPRVLHGYTATKEVPFRDVCAVIRDYAFRSSDLPLIVSLEVHCNAAQQDIMVEIMTDYWTPYLVVAPADLSDTTPLPTLESLKKKILIKVKYTPPKKAKAKSKGNDDEDPDSQTEDDEPSKKGKITEALSKLGTYTRSYHFDNLSQREASIPTHVFSASEGKLASLYEEQAEMLFKHNMNYLMRVYPRGSRVRSTNLDPAPFWRQGCQIVALNWQQMNAAMMLNEAMFEGTAGWVAKPLGYLKTAGNDLVNPMKISFDLSVQLLAAQGLDSQAKTTPNVFVKCELHVGGKEGQPIPRDDKSKDGEWKRRSATRHSKTPDFGGETLDFKGVENIVPELSFVRIKICDDDTFQKDRLLGWTCFRLDRFPDGLQLLRVKGEDARPNGALLLLDSKMTMKKKQ